MLHRGKVLCQAFGNALGRRINRNERRIFLFHFFKCLIKLIIFIIGDQWIILDIIAVLMKSQNLTQAFNAIAIGSIFRNSLFKFFQKATDSFLKELEKGISKNRSDSNRIESLREVLRFHEYRYYIQNDPLISDYEYDQLYKALEKMEQEDPSLISIDSPTQRVAKGLTKDFPTVQHLVPMLSLDNSYNNEDLIDFDRKARELTGLNKIEYCVE